MKLATSPNPGTTQASLAQAYASQILASTMSKASGLAPSSRLSAGMEDAGLDPQADPKDPTVDETEDPIAKDPATENPVTEDPVAGQAEAVAGEAAAAAAKGRGKGKGKGKGKAVISDEEEKEYKDKQFWLFVDDSMFAIRRLFQRRFKNDKVAYADTWEWYVILYVLYI